MKLVVLIPQSPALAASKALTKIDIYNSSFLRSLPFPPNCISFRPHKSPDLPASDLF